MPSSQAIREEEEQFEIRPAKRRAVPRPRKKREIHGECRAEGYTPEYRAWVNMMTRCYNPKSTRYKNWGGRGISVCAEWRTSFAAFLSHVGRRPTSAHQLDRIDNDLNYKPGNVRWASRSEQIRNSRSVRPITAFGKTHILKDWAAKVGINQFTILWRLDNGWEPERALSAPPLELAECGRIANRARWGAHA